MHEWNDRSIYWTLQNISFSYFQKESLNNIKVGINYDHFHSRWPAARWAWDDGCCCKTTLDTVQLCRLCIHLVNIGNTDHWKESKTLDLPCVTIIIPFAKEVMKTDEFSTNTQREWSHDLTVVYLHRGVTMIRRRACREFNGSDSETPNVSFKVVTPHLRSHDMLTDHQMME